MTPPILTNKSTLIQYCCTIIKGYCNQNPSSSTAASMASLFFNEVRSSIDKVHLASHQQFNLTSLKLFQRTLLPHTCARTHTYAQAYRRP